MKDLFRPFRTAYYYLQLLQLYKNETIHYKPPKIIAGLNLLPLRLQLRPRTNAAILQRDTGI